MERGGDVRFFHDLPKMFRQVKRQDGVRGLWKGYLWWQIVVRAYESHYLSSTIKLVLFKGFRKPVILVL